MLKKLSALLTAPGVVVHELAHAAFCVLAGVRIHRIKLFQFRRVAGFVVHEEPRQFYQAFLISLGPLLGNSLLALISFAQVYTITAPRTLLYAYLGVVVGLHAIPSNHDAGALWQTARRRMWRNPLVLLCLPAVLIIYLLNFLKRLHIDFLYVALLWWLGGWYLKA
ncbi:MAG: M50 family metallopeptidase [Candidatus Magasanikbacteria bacterium]|nr:M50 family metallopeptidase [Candidatus Magasanikbacteria bacterium]